MGQSVCKFSVICKNQHSLGLSVKSSNGIDPCRSVLNKHCNAFSVHFIAHGCDKAARLVEHYIDIFLLLGNLFSVNGNGVAFGVNLIAY